MHYTLISLYGASINDFEKISFNEYVNSDTFKQYIKVIYVSDDTQYINIFDNYSDMPKCLACIYDYCKETSEIFYTEQNICVMTGTHLFKNSNARTALMVSDKDIIGNKVDNIYSDANESLDSEAIEFYEQTYELMMKYKYNSKSL